MSRLTRPLVLALLLTIGGCAALRPEPPAERNAALRLDLGLAALHAGQRDAAFEELAWVAAHCSGRTAGLHARTALAALELDPRNPAGRPAIGTELLGELILDPYTPDWVRPTLETAYLMALGLGAPAPPGAPRAGDTTSAPAPADPTPPAQDAADDGVPAVEPDPWTAAAPRVADRPVYACGEPLTPAARLADGLPPIPGPSMAAMLARVRSERDAQATRAQGLEGDVAALRRELEATRAELDRIRRTLQP